MPNKYRNAVKRNQINYFIIIIIIIIIIFFGFYFA